jgi:hypothetical protein
MGHLRLLSDGESPILRHRPLADADVIEIVVKIEGKGATASIEIDLILVIIVIIATALGRAAAATIRVAVVGADRVGAEGKEVVAEEGVGVGGDTAIEGILARMNATLPGLVPVIVFIMIKTKRD